MNATDDRKFKNKLRRDVRKALYAVAESNSHPAAEPNKEFLKTTLIPNADWPKGLGLTRIQWETWLEQLGTDKLPSIRTDVSKWLPTIKNIDRTFAKDLSSAYYWITKEIFEILRPSVS